MSQAIHVTVAAVIERAGRYLMVEETIDSRQVFNQPAGHLEAGESILQAAAREVLEETARAFTPTGLVGIYRWEAPNGVTFVRFAFTGSVGDPQPGRDLDAGITATHWLTETELNARRQQLRSPLVLRCIRDATERPALPLDCLHDLA